MHVCTEPLRLEAQHHFDEVSEIFSLDGLERELSTSIIKQTKTNIAFFTEKAKEIIKNKKMIMGNMASGTWKYAVVLLMNSLIIPGLFFLFFFKLGKVLQSEDEKKIIIQNIKPELEPKLLTAK